MKFIVLKIQVQASECVIQIKPYVLKTECMYFNLFEANIEQ